MPKVSVIIPFQNRIPWLKEAVESVLAQTFQDFEIIIVDNASTDAYEAPNDPRIQYIRQEDRGPAGGRNRGMDVARGDYIAFLDSDDLFMPAKLERQVAFMDSATRPTFAWTCTARRWRPSIRADSRAGSATSWYFHARRRPPRL
jgi:glycosyltransferase involved in cell wall biosynthesis